MIIAIADDFSGAAEIAGIGSSFGLNTILLTQIEDTIPCDLLVLDAATRSLDENAVMEILDTTCSKIKEHYPEAVIFKKIDSVFRGHIFLEASILKIAFGFDQVIFLPANPERGRKIKYGQYFVDGQPIHHTSFAIDPEYPRNTSDVGLLMGKFEGVDYAHLTNKKELDGSNSFISVDIDHKDDLEYYIYQCSKNTLIAGAGESFEVFLSSRGFERMDFLPVNTVNARNLIVKGSIFNSQKEVDFLKMISVSEHKLSLKDDNIEPKNNPIVVKWARDVEASLDAGEIASMYVAYHGSQNHEVSQKILKIIAATVKKIFENTSHENLNILISGGSTASAILRSLNLESFHVLKELAAGIVVLKPVGAGSFTITVKPGSYPWPALAMKEFLSINKKV